MIDRSWAEAFAREWALHWREKNLDALLSHYAEGVVFHSPRIAKVQGTGEDSVSGIGELRAYWRKAVENAGEIRFDIIAVGVGSDAITIEYRNQRSETVAETLVFGKNGKVVVGVVTYLQPIA